MQGRSLKFKMAPCYKDASHNTVGENTGLKVQLCEGKATDKALRFQVEVMAGGPSRLPLS